MSRPSPIHRDPMSVDDDFGCVGNHGDAANAAVDQLVSDAVVKIADETLDTEDAVVDYVRTRMQEIEINHPACGVLDTIVKENVFLALNESLAHCGIYIEARMIYGW